MILDHWTIGLLPNRLEHFWCSKSIFPLVNLRTTGPVQLFRYPPPSGQKDLWLMTPRLVNLRTDPVHFHRFLVEQFPIFILIPWTNYSFYEHEISSEHCSYLQIASEIFSQHYNYRFLKYCMSKFGQFFPAHPIYRCESENCFLFFSCSNPWIWATIKETSGQGLRQTAVQPWFAQPNHHESRPTFAIQGHWLLCIQPSLRTAAWFPEITANHSLP